MPAEWSGGHLLSGQFAALRVRSSLALLDQLEYVLARSRFAVPPKNTVIPRIQNIFSNYYKMDPQGKALTDYASLQQQ